jgi:hypothetical protein
VVAAAEASLVPGFAQVRPVQAGLHPVPVGLHQPSQVPLFRLEAGHPRENGTMDNNTLFTMALVLLAPWARLED